MILPTYALWCKKIDPSEFCSISRQEALNFQWPWFENMHLINETEKQFVVMLVQLL